MILGTLPAGLLQGSDHGGHRAALENRKRGFVDLLRQRHIQGAYGK